MNGFLVSTGMAVEGKPVWQFSLILLSLWLVLPSNVSSDQGSFYLLSQGRKMLKVLPVNLSVTGHGHQLPLSLPSCCPVGSIYRPHF